MRNLVQLIGNIGKNPEQTAITKDQRPVVRFPIAQDVNGMDAATQKLIKKDPQWFQVACFAGVAERALTLGKGELVLVIGELKSRTYQTDKGEKRNSVELIANDIYRLERLRKHKEAGLESTPVSPTPGDFASFEMDGEA